MAATETTAPVRLPPVVPIPKPLAVTAFLAARNAGLKALDRRYSGAFTVRMPIVGNVVVIGDPSLVTDLLNTKDNLLRLLPQVAPLFGPGALLSLYGAEHRKHRRLLIPAFHGKRVSSYEAIVAEEVSRETAGWVEGRAFATMPSMHRIALNSILRGVLGAKGPAFEELRTLLPAMVHVGSRLAMVPQWARSDFGRFSLGGRLARYRRRYDDVIRGLIADARSDPNLADRTDVLSLLVTAGYEDGQPITDSHISDELLNLLAAGYETTAATLTWAVERLCRHPQLLDRLVAETDSGGSALLQATVWEVQRTRPVFQGLIRVTQTKIQLGEWIIPSNSLVAISIMLAQRSPINFANPDFFDPDRFVGNPPNPSLWMPFGGGTRRCVGAPFANMEMLVVLRYLLRHFHIETTSAAGERIRSRGGVTYSPARGGRVTVYRRTERIGQPD
jgi:cytochrome P450